MIKLIAAIITLCCILAGTVDSACPTTTQTAAAFLATSPYTLGPALAPWLGSGFTGTILLPSNDAVDAAIASILSLVSNITGTKVTALPAGTTAASLLANPLVQNVLELHIYPQIVLDPADIPTDSFQNGIFVASGEGIPSRLFNETTSTFCPKAAPKTCVLFPTVEGPSGANFTKFTVKGPSNTAAVQSTVPGICDDAIIHVIDTVLLPCKLSDSVLSTLASSFVPAASPSPSVKVVAGTRDIPSIGSSALCCHGSLAAWAPVVAAIVAHGIIHVML